MAHSPSSTTLLTGATGFLGRYLVRDYAARGRNLAVLVRGDSACDRVAQMIEDMESSANLLGETIAIPLPKIIRADLTQADLGLSVDDHDWLAANVDDVVHCAGDVTFHESGKGEGTWRTNVDGTENLARWSRDNGIEDFSYVSTAFVCGDRSGVIYEKDLDCGQGFGSTYEESKFEAERRLQSYQFPRLSVFRPCFVSGDSTSGYSSTFHGIYWFAQFTSLARLRQNVMPGMRWHHDVRIFKTGAEHHYLIPVDKVSRAICEIQSQSDLASNNYHLTPKKVIKLTDVEAALADCFHYFGVRFAGEKCPDDSSLNEIEQLFYDGLRSMGHRYLDQDPTFDCTQTEQLLPWWTEHEANHEYLIKIFEYAEGKRYGRDSRRRAKKLAVGSK